MNSVNKRARIERMAPEKVCSFEAFSALGLDFEQLNEAAACGDEESRLWVCGDDGAADWAGLAGHDPGRVDFKMRSL